MYKTVLHTLVTTECGLYHDFTLLQMMRNITTKCSRRRFDNYVINDDKYIELHVKC